MTYHTIRRRGVIGAAGAIAIGHVLPARADDTPIVIGQSGHLSGPLAPSFKGTLAGQKLRSTNSTARVASKAGPSGSRNSTMHTTRRAARRTWSS